MENEIGNKGCRHCSRPIKGRTDKKFCGDGCRNAYHNSMNQQDATITRRIWNILKKNRAKLQNLLKRQMHIVNRIDLDDLDFKWEYHTHTKTDRKGNIIRYCFDYGFQILRKNKVKIIDQSK